jgi:hypothetical protein
MERSEFNRGAGKCSFFSLKLMLRHGNKNKTADDFGAISRETPRLICDSWSDPD